MCDVSYHCWVKRQEITDPDKMMGCWEFSQILLFTLVMAVILVQCHYAHQLYILNWMLNLYFYDSIITEKDKWLKHFLWFYTWFHFNYLNTSPNSPPSLKFHCGLLSNQPNTTTFFIFTLDCLTTITASSTHYHICPPPFSFYHHDIMP